MNPSCLKYALTEEERRTFNETGYLIVENALSPEQVRMLTAECDRVHQQKIREGYDPKTVLTHKNFVPDSDLFLDMVDYEKILPKVWGVLGWNIYLYHASMMLTPPTGLEKKEYTFSWHQDSGQVNHEPEFHPRPRLSLKVAYFLSDASEPDRGNLWLIPGSHLYENLELPEKGQPEGAIPVCVKPGTAVLFDRRIWHAGTMNWSDITRKVLFYGYGYRWIRTREETTVEQLWDKCDPIRRQLLSAAVNCDGYYTPTDEDVPLRTWLKEHQPKMA
ncbi:phytanoyl-CoA dioxygenase family protein [Paenibacillus montanisoli]|uniref:Phytanoyl-CoA dioxygenase n=1 Tax=Paenibacillus montanisoli TaxID=2081970 RepID=A0A328UEP2_9BACL|nr:phytanoyl-CoA dioxygenase family protein [Paenibacillus montanisoli]RAP78426.1 hypothetical protein DL346_08375 [Paenibacillus montanisoli]